jgi:hypothetical protein
MATVHKFCGAAAVLSCMSTTAHQLSSNSASMIKHCALYGNVGENALASKARRCSKLWEFGAVQSWGYALGNARASSASCITGL